MIYFNSQFQRFKSMAGGLHCYWPWWGRTSQQGACDRGKLLTSWWLGSREREREREVRARYICLSKASPVTHFLLLGPTSKHPIQLWTHQWINPLMRSVASWSNHLPIVPLAGKQAFNTGASEGTLHFQTITHSFTSPSQVRAKPQGKPGRTPFCLDTRLFQTFILPAPLLGIAVSRVLLLMAIAHLSQVHASGYIPKESIAPPCTWVPDLSFWGFFPTLSWLSS
jgi:hypothetical protein